MGTPSFIFKSYLLLSISEFSKDRNDVQCFKIAVKTPEESELRYKTT